jgi:hypothetical protein
MQVDPIEPKLKCLEIRAYYRPPSNFAFNFNLCRYTKGETRAVFELEFHQVGRFRVTL